MDIFSNTIEEPSDNFLEIDRFKAKFQQIWQMMLETTYDKYDNNSMSKEEYMELNALKFSDDPEPESELDEIMDMLDSLLNEDEKLESVKADGKAPTYKGNELSANNETRKLEATDYEYNHQSTKTPNDARSRSKGGSYVGTPSNQITKRKSDSVKTEFAPIAESLQEELLDLIKRQAIGRRRQLFRA